MSRAFSLALLSRKEKSVAIPFSMSGCDCSVGFWNTTHRKAQALNLGSLDLRGFWAFHIPASMNHAPHHPVLPSLFPLYYPPPWAIRLDASAAHSPTTSCPI